MTNTLDKPEFKYNNYGFNSNNSIAIIWSIDDVRDSIEGSFEGLELTDDECMEVLWHVDKKHDAEWGVGWENIRDAIEFCFEDKLEELADKRLKKCLK